LLLIFKKSVFNLEKSGLMLEREKKGRLSN